jgi:glucose/mannose transport system substrate-binding protein
VLGSKQGQETFNKLKGSICARTDCDYSAFDAYLQSSAADWQTDAILPSVVHGAAASEGWATAYIDAIGAFVTSRDVAGAQEPRSRWKSSRGGRPGARPPAWRN